MEAEGEELKGGRYIACAYFLNDPRPEKPGYGGGRFWGTLTPRTSVETRDCDECTDTRTLLTGFVRGSVLFLSRNV